MFFKQWLYLFFQNPIQFILKIFTIVPGLSWSYLLPSSHFSWNFELFFYFKSDKIELVFPRSIWSGTFPGVVNLSLVLSSKKTISPSPRSNSFPAHVPISHFYVGIMSGFHLLKVWGMIRGDNCWKLQLYCGILYEYITWK